MLAHLADTFLHDSFERPAPSCVEHTYRGPLAIYDDDRNTIRGLHRDQQAGSIRDQSIAGQEMPGWSVSVMNYVGMNLAQSDERPAFSAGRDTQFLQEQFSVPLDSRGRVILRKSQIQRIAAIAPRHPASACRKGVH